MQAQIMTLDEIRPFIRFAEYTAGARTPRFVQAVDHRLFYVESGSGDVWVDGNVHGVAPGTLMYWMSGSPYTFLPKAGTELRLLSINFDFTWKHAGLTLPFPPSSDYQEEKRLKTSAFRTTSCSMRLSCCTTWPSSCLICTV